jgi:hypothetical protein
MQNVIEKLRAVGVEDKDFVYLNYEDNIDVWHISDDYIEVALAETNTASMLAALLATRGITVLSRYAEDVLQRMRDEGLLDDYNRDDWFEDYLTAKIQKTAYEHDLLTVSTTRHDHKRGSCEVASNVKVLAGELYRLGQSADSFVAGFDVAVQTAAGTLTLD